MDAITAIKAFNGSMLMGSKISVSLAKYNKLGLAFRQKNGYKCSGKISVPLANCSWRVKYHGMGNFTYPTYRDARKYDHVV